MNDGECRELSGSASVAGNCDEPLESETKEDEGKDKDEGPSSDRKA